MTQEETAPPWSSRPPRAADGGIPVRSKTWKAVGRALTRRNARRLVELAKVSLGLAVSLYLLWLFHIPVWKRGLGYDEQFFLWTGWSITKGLAPYRDFVEYKPPVLFLTQWLAIKLFGLEQLKIRAFFLLLMMGAFGSVYLSLISRRANKAWSCAIVCTAVYFFSNLGYHDTSYADAESPGYAYYLLGVACLLARTTPRGRNITLGLGGAFMALCFFTKEPFAPCILPTWGAAFFAEPAGPSRFQDFKRYLLFTTIGVGGVILGLAAYMAPSGALRAYVKMLLSYGELFRDPTKSYCVLLGRFQPTGSALRDLPGQWKIVHDNFFNFATFGFVAPAFAASIVFLARRSIPLLVLGCVSIAGGLYTTTASHCFWAHYYVMAQTGIFFFLFLGVDAASAPLRRAPPAVGQWATLAFVVALGLPIYQRYDSEKEEWDRMGHHMPVPPFSESIPGEIAFVKENSSPQDRIFTSGPPGIYFQADRVHAARDSTFMDEVLLTMRGDTDEEKLQSRRDELRRTMPKIFILDPERSVRKVRITRALFMPFLEEFKYNQVGPYYYVRPG
jgi:hypothetical protein